MYQCSSIEHQVRRRRFGLRSDRRRGNDASTRSVGCDRLRLWRFAGRQRVDWMVPPVRSVRGPPPGKRRGSGAVGRRTAWDASRSLGSRSRYRRGRWLTTKLGVNGGGLPTVNGLEMCAGTVSSRIHGALTAGRHTGVLTPHCLRRRRRWVARLGRAPNVMTIGE